MQSHPHSVVLVAPNGREQAASIKVSHKGIVLSTLDQKELNTFPLQLIRKWMPSNMRSKNVGLPDSLDIQILTDQGPRDLRMRCADISAVQTIMQELITTTQEAGLQLPLVVSSSSKAMLSPRLQPPAPGPTTSALSAAPENPTTAPATLDPATCEGIPAPPPLSAATSLASTPAPLPPAPSEAAPSLQSLSASVDCAAPPSVPLLASAPGGAASCPQTSASLPQVPGEAASNEQLDTPAEAPLVSTPAHPPPAADSNVSSRGVDMPSAADSSVNSRGVDMPPSPEEHPLPVAAQPVAATPLDGDSNSSAGAAVEQTPSSPGVPLVPGGLEDSAAVKIATTEEAEAAAAGGIAAELLFDLVSVVAAAAPSAARVSDELQEQAAQLTRENAALVQARDSLEAELQAARLTAQQLAVEREQEVCRLAAGAMAELAVARAVAGRAVAEAERERREREQELSGCKASLHASVRETRRFGQELKEVQAALAASEQQVQEQVAQAQAREQGHQEASEAWELRVGELGRQLLELEQQLLEARALGAHAAREAGRAQEELGQRCGAQERELQELSHRCAVQQAELAAGQARILSALEGQAILQVELASIREQFEAADAQAGREHAEVLWLRGSLAAVEAQAAALRGREEEMQALILSSAGEAEAARAEAGSMSVGQRELQMEAEVLRERLASVRQTSRDQALAEVQGQLSEVTEQLRQALQGEESAKQQAADQRACAEQLQQDAASLTCELTALRTALDESRSQQSSMSVLSSSALEKVRVLEQNCEEAVERLERAQRQLEEREACLQGLQQRLEAADRCQAEAAEDWGAERQGMVAEWEVERQGMVAEWEAERQRLIALLETERQGLMAECEAERQGAMSELEAERQGLMAEWERERQGSIAQWKAERQGMEGKWEAERLELEARVSQLSMALGKVEVDALSKYDGLLGLVDQVGSLSHELQGAQVSQARQEEQARLQKAVHVHELCALEAKLAAVVENSGRRVAAAEQQVEAKEQLLARWREDAQGIAVKLEGALGEHRRELEEQRQEALGLQQQVKALRADNAALRAQLGEVQSAAGYLRSLAGEGDVRLTQLAAQLAESRGRERELEQEVQALNMLLERARVAFAARPSPGRAAAVSSPVQSARDSRPTGLSSRQKHGEAAAEPAAGEGAIALALKGSKAVGAEAGRRTASIVVLASE